MRTGESIFALFMVLLCAAYLFFSQKIDIGTMNEPGAGFMPVVIGVTGLLISSIILIISLKEQVVKKAETISAVGMKRFIGCVAASILFIPVFKVLGTLIAVFALVLAMTKILGGQGWGRPIFLAATSSVIAYVLFIMILDVPLPLGIF